MGSCRKKRKKNPKEKTPTTRNAIMDSLPDTLCDKYTGKFIFASVSG